MVLPACCTILVPSQQIGRCFIYAYSVHAMANLLIRSLVHASLCSLRWVSRQCFVSIMIEPFPFHLHIQLRIVLHTYINKDLLWYSVSIWYFTVKTSSLQWSTNNIQTDCTFISVSEKAIVLNIMEGIIISKMWHCCSIGKVPVSRPEEKFAASMQVCDT